MKYGLFHFIDGSWVQMNTMVAKSRRDAVRRFHLYYSDRDAFSNPFFYPWKVEKVS